MDATAGVSIGGNRRLVSRLNAALLVKRWFNQRAVNDPIVVGRFAAAWCSVYSGPHPGDPSIAAN